MRTKGLVDCCVRYCDGGTEATEFRRHLIPENSSVTVISNLCMMILGMRGASL